MEVIDFAVRFFMGLVTEDPGRVISYYNLDLATLSRRNGVIALSAGIFFLLSGILAANAIIFLLFPLVVFLTFFFVSILPAVRYNDVMGTITEYSDLIYNELATVKIYSNSIIDAIRFISDGQYPYLSKELSGILGRIQCGATPEKEILVFLDRYPLPMLVEGWGLFFESKRTNQGNIQVSQELAQQIAMNRFEEQTGQLETRIMLYVGVSLFVIPIYQILGSVANWNVFSLFSCGVVFVVLFIFEAALFRRISVSRFAFGTVRKRGRMR
ncbi:MAG: hypothetical protein ACTSW4_03695 [Candidatus Ranarchaeia archaeon]